MTDIISQTPTPIGPLPHSVSTIMFEDVAHPVLFFMSVLVVLALIRYYFDRNEARRGRSPTYGINSAFFYLTIGATICIIWTLILILMSRPK